ncbi:NAD(P)/FAD-dependent oxidoreductase [Pelagibacterium montanilacus]|uniref:NAD(P)/FAD-dependent oxidoreductase n=1 Tax=Pelagibacterium montanilacus TaxID=2185280 RepID=UPI000F8E2824|nr:FAD-binding oxidoreductase [Pelagibacterium montanilacus]
MLKDTHHSNLWQASAPPPPHTEPLSGNAVADVAIIGAGYTGLSAALHLAQAGLRPVVLEAREIGHGGSGRNVGLVNAGMWVMPEDLMETLGESWGMTLISALGQGPATVFDLIERHAIDCEAERNGTLHLAVGASGYVELGQRERQWQALGAPVTRLDPDAAARLIGSDAFAGALLDRRAGTIQPLAYARGLARAALELGAVVHTSTPVTGADHADGKWTLRTPSGTLTAPWVIVATNAYTGLERGFPFAAQSQELTMLPFFQVATAPLSSNVAGTILPERQGCWDTRAVMTSLRKDRAGRLIFGSVGALDGFARGTQEAFARRSLEHIFAGIEIPPFEHVWHGQIGMTGDALPKFHAYGPNAIGVNGFNGRGIAPGTVFGRAMARMIAYGEDMILPSAPIGKARFPRLRTRFYRAGSQALHFISGRI